MNKEQFIASGLLEQHVLGLTDPQEEQVVAEFLQKHPELQEEVSALHRAMEQYAMQHAIPPPPGLRDQVMQAVDQQIAQQQPLYQRMNWSWVAVAACLLATTYGVYQYRQTKTQQQEITTLQAEYAALEKFCEQQQERAIAQQAVVNKIQHPATQSILLNGTAIAENRFAVAYWNADLEEGWLDPTDLPALEQGLQYQIWADVHGEMLPIGLIEPGNRDVIPIAYLPEAESINITQERLGGADHPNVSLLTVNGLL